MRNFKCVYACVRARARWLARFDCVLSASVPYYVCVRVRACACVHKFSSMLAPHIRGVCVRASEPSSRASETVCARDSLCARQSVRACVCARARACAWALSVPVSVSACARLCRRACMNSNVCACISACVRSCPCAHTSYTFVTIPVPVCVCVFQYACVRA